MNIQSSLVDISLHIMMAHYIVVNKMAKNLLETHLFPMTFSLRGNIDNRATMLTCFTQREMSFLKKNVSLKSCIQPSCQITSSKFKRASFHIKLKTL